MQQGLDAPPLQPLAALQEVELDRESQSRNLSAQLPHELHCSLHCASGGEEIVDDDDTLARLDRI